MHRLQKKAPTTTEDYIWMNYNKESTALAACKRKNNGDEEN